MEKEDKILLALVQDKIDQRLDYEIPVNTGFLDLRQRGLVDNYCKRIKGLEYRFDGGYEDAERCICLFLVGEETQASPLAVLRVNKEGPTILSHRDYMGSILGLGIKREMVGDILVHEKGADILILEELSDFFLKHYEKAGRVTVKTQIVGMEEICSPMEDFEEARISVASLRLDNVIAAAFKVSRSQAAYAINGGAIYLNGQQSLKPDRLVPEASKLVFRGKGKIILQCLMGQTKKDKWSILIKRYI